jgi:hypothetical protein
MVKSLKHWNNRETTLLAGNELYFGRVSRYLFPQYNADGESIAPMRLYYFETSEGERIDITRRNVKGMNTRVGGRGLILKLNFGGSPIAQIH